MSKKILFMSSAKLTALSIGLLLAVFCTIGMSFRPVYDENEAEEIVMSGPRRSHWHWTTTACGLTTHHYKSSKDFAQTQVQTMGNGIATISTEETTNVTSPASGSPRVASTTAVAGNTASISWNSGLEHNDNETAGYDDATIAAAHKKTFTLTATPADPDEYYFAGWGTSTSESSINNNDNPRVIISDMGISGYTDTSSEPANYATNTYTETYYAFFKPRLAVDITLEPDANGSISYSYKNVATTTISGETTFTTKYDVTLTAAPADGYKFFGWYTMSGSTENFLSYSETYTRAYPNNITIYAKFIPSSQAVFNIKGTEQYYYDLGQACLEASSSSSKIVYPIEDGMVPAGSYTIPSGVTLLVPYNSANNTQTKPALVKSESTLYAYRKLTLVDGVNITVNGDICVGGQQTCMTGGKPSGYATGACGVLDMSSGGHIELNSGSNLYAWGFVKGQDMDQGNNTVGVGTITANNGAKVWEDFAVGDWRGGSACLDIQESNFFPFQSYFIQNIEVPLTVNYGAVDNCYASVSGGGEYLQLPATMIGTTDALFKLSSGSVVRKWYDATTDLMCFELSGTANLDAVVVKGLPVIGNISSKDYYLPISSNMHIILTKSSVEISKPMVLQPGAKVEIKSDATITISSNVFLYDQTEWGPYAGPSYYFHNYGNTYGILTTHKNRGNGKSKDLLDDAQFIVDGQLNITGKLYTTASGADIMGNDGGRVQFSAIPTSSSSIDAFTGNGDAVSGGVTVNTANLHNEDDSYTKSIGSTTFHNVDGRWFTAAAKDSKADHTYDFTYIKSGVVSGTGGTDTLTNACYSNDKTGLEARMKWVNIDPDACPNWWIGHKDTYFYNWTENSDWHQFIPTATEGMYSGSNNKIYTKTDCVWGELGETDVNCLYTIGGVKKALVEGEFIALEPNNNDPAYHAADDVIKYYICFSGCNWHEADKYDEVQKAYIIEPDTFIWYNNAWMSVNFKQPFAYTLDETNVPVYYEYLNGEWILAEPYVRVVDGIEDRSYYFIEDAFKFANSVLRTAPTITILHDISGITTALSYTGANKTCTLDLNGHTINGTVNNMITVNAAGCTFYVVDNTTEKKGKINYVFAANNSRRRAFYVQNGHVILNSGTIATTNTLAYSSTYTKPIAEGVLVANGKQFTMNGGRIEVSSAHNPYGVEGASSTPTININGGTIEAVAETRTSPCAIYSYGTINITGGTINAIAKANTSAIGVEVVGNGATANISGGTILARSTGSSQGVYCWGSATVTGDYNAETPDNTPKSRSYSIVNITGGTITAECTTSTKAYGVISYGTTNISGGTITATVQKSNQNTAYGVCTIGGVTTISDGANITANAPTIAYGVTATAANGSSSYGWAHLGELHVEGGTITANTTGTTTAYGLLVTGATWTINKTDGYSVFNGDYAGAGTAIVTGGTFIVNAKTTLARGIAVGATKTLNAASATPKCTINGGYYKMTGTGDVLGCNTSALAADFHLNGGYYSHDGNLATYTPSPKHVLTLASDDANRPPYYYKVAEAYLVTFKNEDGTANIIDPVYQEVGTTPVCSTEPTKESTSTNSFTFDGWATEANGTKVYDPNGLPNVTSAGATYYAHFATTTLKYRVHFDAATNGGECATENIYVNPSSAISTEIATLPTATKYGYTFNGWYTAASSGTKITSATVPTADVTYYAQFTVNSHTLTWDLAGGKVSTAGKIGSTTWPAKNTTGTPSTSVAFGTVLTTIPVVTKTGYTFNRWDPIPTSSMPDENVTYTALWNPNTNTAYTVKHYLQNVDGTYPEEPVETEALTGTTAASVTPAVKSYDGFVSPATKTKTIAADGTLVVEYQYARQSYTIDLDATTNGGTCATASVTALHEATIASLPEAVKEEGKYAFLGWFTKAEGGTQITDASIIGYNMQKLYAQFSPEVTTYTITWRNEDNSVLREDVVEFDAIPSYGSTPTKEADAQYTYTFNGWTPAFVAARADASYTATFSSTLNKYAITFKNGDDVLQSSEIDYGTPPSYSGTPTKPTTESYTYTFDGWSTAIDGDVVDPLPAVSAEATYYAHFAATANVACVKEGSADPTYYTDFAEAWEATNSATGEVTLKLLQDVTGITNSLAYTNAQNCTLDLNNHTISGTVSKLIDVNATGKTFTIDDSSAEKEGKISMITSENARVYGLFITAGIVKLKHGTIYSQNTHAYSSAAANKNSAATAVYVAAGQTFTMENGTVESASQYASYAIYMARGTSTVTIKNGLVKGRTTKSTTAAGIYNLGKGLTINGGRIVGHAYTTTAYGIYLSGGHGTINGGTIEATNDTTSSKGTTTTYGIYVNYYSSTYKGVLTIPSTSTVEVFAKARTTTAAAVTVGGSSTGSTIAGGTFTAKTKTSSTAYGVYSSGNITISGGTFNVIPCTSTGYGIYSLRGKVTISGSPTFNVTTATTTAYGAFAYGTIGKKGTGKYSGTIEINGGTFNVTSTKETAYGAYAGLMKRDLTKCSATNDTVPGMHYMPGIISITNGTFNVKATTTGAYGIVVAAAKSESGTVGTTTRIPLGTITGGKFKVESIGDANATAYAVNTATTAERLVVEGGWYNTDKTNASSNATIGGKYTAPTKNCDYHVLPLPEEELPYKYKVAEAYTVTFKDGDNNTIQSGLVEKNTIPAYTGATPTKTATAQCTYTFNNTWSPVITAVTGDATYTAQFNSTVNKYTITWVDGNGETLKTEQVAYGQTPAYTGATPTKTATDQYTYTFNNTWSPAIVSVTGDATYTAQFGSTVNKYDIMWVDGDGVTLKTEQVEYGQTPAYTGATPTKTATAQYTYTFNNTWSPAIVSVTGDATYTAQFGSTVNKYTITWVDGNGETLKTEQVEYGQTPAYTGETPTKTATAQYTYTFNNTWSPEIVAVTEEATYTAQFGSTVNKYTITWVDGNGETLKTEQVAYGQTPAYSGETPTKTANAQYTYAFNNTWSPAIVAVSEDATYTATYTETARVYSVSLNTNEGVINAGNVENYTYGVGATLPTNVTKEGYTFGGWFDNSGLTGDAITSISDTTTGDKTYWAKWALKKCTITWLNWDGYPLTEPTITSTVNYGSAPGYSLVGNPTPTRESSDGKTYEWDGWTTGANGAGTFYNKDSLPNATGDATYYAHFRITAIDVASKSDISIDEDAEVTTTTVRVEGKLNVPENRTLTTDDLILEGTPSSSGEIIGEGTVTATHAYFDFSNGAEGFKARRWYAVAVPWQVEVTAYGSENGVYLTNDGENYTRQVLGSTFDLIYYDGERRAAQGHSDDCWKYVEDDDASKHIMYPGRAYMIYLTSDAQTIRFERKSGTDLITNTLAVYAFELKTGKNKDANWNGIANPATYHAYINANVKNYSSGVLNVGQVYNAETRTYSLVNMSDNNLVVGQPIFVQAIETNTSVVAYAAHDDAFHAAPRRAKVQDASLTHYELMIAPNEGDVTDRIIVRMDDEKETDEYIVGQDLVKMGVSDIVPQMWVDRYDGKMCINTVAPVNNRADYPLGISVQQSGAYDIFIDDQPDDETMLYLTYDGEAIWNLSYGGYVANLEKGSNTHYGLRIVRSPKVTTDIEEATILNGEAVRKVVIEDKVFIIRNDQIYGIDGRLAK